MAKNQNVRITPAQMQADKDAYLALQGIANYTPANTAYTLEAVAGKMEAMKATQEEEFAIQNALATARDTATAAEWEFHNFILAVKEQIIAQFGKDSNELQSLGLKKKSEYKAPALRGKAKAA